MYPQIIAFIYAEIDSCDCGLACTSCCKVSIINCTSEFFFAANKLLKIDF